MSEPETWTEFECPNCGMDSDIEPPQPIGSTYRCANCDRTTVLDETNSQTLRRESDNLDRLAEIMLADTERLQKIVESPDFHPDQATLDEMSAQVAKAQRIVAQALDEMRCRDPNTA